MDLSPFRPPTNYHGCCWQGDQMKSTAQILEYIQSQYALFLENPTAYFETPHSMEAALIELEMLYYFIVDPDWSFPPTRFGYRDFLRHEGFGVGRFIGDDAVDKSDFTALAEFWRRYLSSEFRKR